MIRIHGAHRNFRILPCVAEMRLFGTHFKNHESSIAIASGSLAVHTDVIYRYQLTLCLCRYSAVQLSAFDTSLYPLPPAAAHLRLPALQARTGCGMPGHGRCSAWLPHIKWLARQLKISEAEAKERDQKVRAQIAQELGHGRVEVTNAYLG